MQARAPQLPGVDHGRWNGDGHYVRSANPVVKGLERVLDQISGLDLPVLIIGEPGTGKRTLALRLHRLASRNGELFSEVSAADLNNEFLQQEDIEVNGSTLLFARGTLYISDLAEVIPNCQPWLMQALAREPIAGNEIRARLVVSSAISLDEVVGSGRFREDLYYGLSSLCLRVPPLRHRRDDIPALSEHFLEKYSTIFRRPKPSLTPQVWRFLLEHNWPGNIRELENMVKRYVIVGKESQIIRELSIHKPIVSSMTGSSPLWNPKGGDGHAQNATVTAPAPIVPFTPAASNDGGSEQEMPSLLEIGRRAAMQAEREAIERVLAQTRWNRRQAAKILKISYKALLNKLKLIEEQNQAAQGKQQSA
jgi:two-component system, NtrC family, response regulator AtoC